MNPPDDRHLAFATRLAYQAGAFLLDRFDPSGTQARTKEDQSLVTEVDLAADRMIAEALHSSYPEDGLLSEEFHQIYVSGERVVWVVDPLDGTTNYSLGLPFWGVSIARLVDGLPETAALYFPPLGEMYTARLGGGAFLNHKPIQVKPPVKDQPASFFACCSRTHRMYNITVPYKPRILGSAAYSFCSLSRGIALLAFEATPKVWDLAGAWLVVTEARGVIETLDGSIPFPLISGTDYSKCLYPTLAAATRKLADRAHGQITPV